MKGERKLLTLDYYFENIVLEFLFLLLLKFNNVF